MLAKEGGEAEWTRLTTQGEQVKKTIEQTKIDFKSFRNRATGYGDAKNKGVEQRNLVPLVIVFFEAAMNRRVIDLA